jgi:tetratricopeptide (TPR) repeat protein
MLRQGLYIELLELCRPIADAAERLPALTRFHVRRLTATCLDCLGDYPAALGLLDACCRDAGDWQETHEEGRLLILLCSVLRKLHRHDAAEEAGQKALTVARRLGDAAGEAWALNELAKLMRNRGRPAESARLAKAGLEVADRTDDPILRIQARAALASTMVSGSNLRRPEQLYQEALGLWQQAGTVRTQAQLLQSLADIARRQTRNEDAMRLVNQAIDIFQRIGDRTGEGIARNCRGRILNQMGKQHAAEALNELRHSLHIALNLNHSREVASVLTGLAVVFADQGTVLLAAACYQTALDMHTALGLDWKKGRRYLAKLRSRFEPTGIIWSDVEQAVAAERFALLTESTGIDPGTWQRFLTARKVPRDPSAADPKTPIGD